MRGKKSRNCRTRQNRPDVRLKKAIRSLEHARREGYETAYHEKQVAILSARVAALAAGGAA